MGWFAPLPSCSLPSPHLGHWGCVPALAQRAGSTQPLSKDSMRSVYSLLSLRSFSPVLGQGEFTEFSTQSHLWLQEEGNGKKGRGGDQDNSGKRQAFTSYCVLNTVVLFFFFFDRFIDCFYINFCTNILLQCFLRTRDRDILNLRGGGELVGRGKSDNFEKAL